MPLLYSFVGKSGVGKTTLIVKLLQELKARGVRVAVVKHHAHTTPIDTPGKDSWRFSEAGADLVVVSSPVEWARLQRVPREKTLAEIAEQMPEVDVILAEGFKREPASKVYVSRAELGTDLVVPPDELSAIVSDHPVTLVIPHFDLHDAAGLAAWLLQQRQ